MKEARFITLSRKCNIYRPVDELGGETSTVYEPAYINTSQIESMFFSGLTVITMVSGDKIEVLEAPQTIITAILVDQINIED